MEKDRGWAEGGEAEPGQVQQLCQGTESVVIFLNRGVRIEGGAVEKANTSLINGNNSNYSIVLPKE